MLSYLLCGPPVFTGGLFSQVLQMSAPAFSAPLAAQLYSKKGQCISYVQLIPMIWLPPAWKHDIWGRKELALL